MKPLLILFFVVAFLCPGRIVLSQEISDVRWVARDTTSGSVQVTAYWNKGEKKKFRAYKFNKVFKNDSLISEKTVMDAIMEFEVIDSTAEGYGMTFRMLENKQKNANALTSELPLEQLDLKEDDLTLRYTTDANGSLKAITNRIELEGRLDQIMQMVRKKQMEAFKDNSEGERKMITAISDKAANGKVLFSTMYEVFISQFHNLHGYVTGINDTLNYKESIIHPATNKPIDFDCYLYVATADTLGMVRFDTDKYGDMTDFPKDYAAYLQATREASGLKRDKKIEEGAAGLGMEMNTYISNVVDTNSGWPSYIKLTRVIATKKPESEDTEYRDEIWELDSDLGDKEEKR